MWILKFERKASFKLGFVDSVPHFIGHSAPRFIGRQLDMQVYQLDSLAHKNDGE